MSTQPSDPSRQPVLIEAPPVPEDILFVNFRCMISEQGGIRVGVVNGTAMFRYACDDVAAEDMFIAQAQAAGFASSRELASALARTPSTLQRRRRRFEKEGAVGILRRKPGPKGQRLSEAQDAIIRKLHKQGLSERGIAGRLRVAPLTINRARRRLGLTEEVISSAQQTILPIVDASGTCADVDATPPAVDQPAGAPPAPAEERAVDEDASAERPSPLPFAGIPPVPVSGGTSMDTDPMDRTIDRMLAAQGQLLDAVPLFASGSNIPRLGALLAVPGIVGAGLFEESEKLYNNIGPAFYGLRTSLLALVLFALLRVKRPENLKEYSPPDLGRVIGLDRAPEVKTLRRKLKILANGPSEQLATQLANRRARRDEGILGFLYVDGHVRVYSGKHRLPKGHVTRMKISLPATQDLWFNDANGDPVFFVTMEGHPSLASAIEGAMDEVRDLVGPDRRVTWVFDRGGWSPKLFKKMDKANCDVLTYRKGATTVIPHECFVPYPSPKGNGDKPWLLSDLCTWVGSEKDGLWMRQVTRLKGAHQTQILTTRQDLEPVELAYRMFARWQQENFFKYMKEEYAIDAMVEYGFEEEDELREIPNPAWKKANKRLDGALKELQRLEAEYGASLLTPESQGDMTKDAGSAVVADLRPAIAERRSLAEKLRAERDTIPKRITVGDLSDEDRTVRLPARRKNFSDAMKMLAYQVETDLVRAVAPHYRRTNDEGRTLITAALSSAGDLAIVGDELHVTLNPQSSPHRTRAIADLCEILNATDTRFPGTDLRLRYATHDSSCVN